MDPNQFRRLVELLQCPITQDDCLISEPRVASDGYTYEHEAIGTWLERVQSSPMTREPLELTTTRNRLVERIIDLVREVDPSLRLSPSTSITAFARAVRLREPLDRFVLSPLEFIAYFDEMGEETALAALAHLSAFEECANHILPSIAHSADLTHEYFRLGGSPFVRDCAVGTATLPPEQFLTFSYFAQLPDADARGLSARAAANYRCATQPETAEDLRAADLDARLAAAAKHAGPLFNDDELETHKHLLKAVGYLARHYAYRVEHGLRVDLETISPELLVWPITNCAVSTFGGSEPLAFAFLSARRTGFVPDSETAKLVRTTPAGAIETLAHRAHALGLAGMAWMVASQPTFPINAGEPHITELLGDCPECHFFTVALASGAWRRKVLLAHPQRIRETDDPLLDAEFSALPSSVPRSAERTMALLRNTRCEIRKLVPKQWEPVTDEAALALVGDRYPARFRFLSPPLLKKAIMATPRVFVLLPVLLQKRLLKDAELVARLEVDETLLTPKTLELYHCARQACGAIQQISPL